MVKGTARPTLGKLHPPGPRVASKWAALVIRGSVQTVLSAVKVGQQAGAAVGL